METCAALLENGSIMQALSWTPAVVNDEFCVQSMTTDLFFKAPGSTLLRHWVLGNEKFV